MDSPTTSTANDENGMRSPIDAKTYIGARYNGNASTRRALTDLPANVAAQQQGPAFLRKALPGSPLKRSFTAAMETGEGLRYLKRRRLGEDETLSQVHESEQSSGRGLGSLRPPTEDNETQIWIPDAHEPSPTEPNTPSEKDGSACEDDSSTERKSFSSLINYDPSSQSQSRNLWSTTSNAEMLKLRLRVAVFKVRTGQVEVPFAELQTNNGSSIPDTVNRNIYDPDAVSQAVEQLREEARERLQKVPIPQLKQAPILKPTAYSSRMIYVEDFQLSPPAANELLVAHPAVTPRQGWPQLSSPPSSTERELTSSVVKGRVAEGLLGLRNAA